MGMETRITALEESVAHLVKVVDDLSEVIARQDREIDRLARRLQMIMEREQDSAGSIPLADQKPPHW
ncbi:MAG: SlyX protein [Rhodobacterales bacterium CG2_30_65_12]|nr:MAG: SlyX protein [Rhodobacterales bacterium CG2_30_65_12]